MGQIPDEIIDRQNDNEYWGECVGYLCGGKLTSEMVSKLNMLSVDIKRALLFVNDKIGERMMELDRLRVENVVLKQIMSEVMPSISENGLARLLDEYYHKYQSHQNKPEKANG